MTKCRPYDYRTLRGNKVTETIECGELGNVNVNLWVSNVPVADQGVFFVSQGRRISEISDIKSFMKVSVARWGVWKHPNLCGYIEVGEVLQPVITRDEFTRTSTRGKVYKAIVKVTKYNGFTLHRHTFQAIQNATNVRVSTASRLKRVSAHQACATPRHDESSPGARQLTIFLVNY